MKRILNLLLVGAMVLSVVALSIAGEEPSLQSIFKNQNELPYPWAQAIKVFSQTFELKRAEALRVPTDQNIHDYELLRSLSFQMAKAVANNQHPPHDPEVTVAAMESLTALCPSCADVIRDFYRIDSCGKEVESFPWEEVSEFMVKDHLFMYLLESKELGEQPYSDVLATLRRAHEIVCRGKQ